MKNNLVRKTLLLVVVFVCLARPGLADRNLIIIPGEENSG